MGLVYKNGTLHFGETQLVPIPSLLQQYTTPFYLYDMDGLRTRVKKLQSVFPGIHVHFAVKSNSCVPILSLFREEGTGVDVVSGGEIDLAQKAGFQANQIIFSGVGKTKAELVKAISQEIFQINVESPAELLRIIEIARTLKKIPKIAFRYNPDVDAKTHPYISTGFRENKFGMGDYFLPELREILRNNQGAVELCGTTLHIGSQLQDLTPLESAIAKTLPIFASFAADGHPMRTFDVGGGLGIPYDRDHEIPSKDLDLLDRYGALLQRALKGFTGQVLCEPGRILVGSCGTLVSEIQYVKESPDRAFLIIDTGMHHLIRPALYQAEHRILPVILHKNRKEKTYDIVGPICESSDALGKARTMQESFSGEFLAIADAGAYGITMASGYNEHQFPKQLFWEKGKIKEA